MCRWRSELNDSTADGYHTCSDGNGRIVAFTTPLPQDQGPPRAAAARIFDRALSRAMQARFVFLLGVWCHPNPACTICSLGGARAPTDGEQIALRPSNVARGSEQTTPPSNFLGKHLPISDLLSRAESTSRGTSQIGK